MFVRFVVALAFVAGSAAQGAEVTSLVLGTAIPGGGFTVYGEALANAVRDADPSLDIRVQQTAGSKENIPLLESGVIDLRLVEGTAAYEALSGIGGAPAGLTVVAAMYPTPAMFAVRADSAYRAIADLRGRRVVFGAKGSGFVLLARYVLDGLGLDFQRDFVAVLLESAKEGPPMVLDGKAAAKIPPTASRAPCTARNRHCANVSRRRGGPGSKRCAGLLRLP
ncbi:MAG TPA: TAXI family TRAP transporter solute-binding subunit [Burkholderiales bacterium]|nr:TAXI family TRAP transporter solute-binding subunit [Burkholderiales bacterium]